MSTPRCTSCGVSGKRISELSDNTQWHLPPGATTRLCQKCFALDQVVFYAKQNAKKKYLLTTHDNTFGGISQPWVMVDTGCSSLLLSLAEGQLADLYTRFPFETHNWHITGSVGVGALNSLTLVIRTPPESIPVCLGGSSLTVPYLRFHLCIDDAKVHFVFLALT